MREDIVCKKCGSDQLIKNGTRKYGPASVQAWKCKECGHAFDEVEGNTFRDKEVCKKFALLAYQQGLSYRKIANIIGVSDFAVRNWLKPVLTDNDIASNAVNKKGLTKEKEENISDLYYEV